MDKEEVFRQAERIVSEAWASPHAAELARQRTGMVILDLNITVFLFTILLSTVFLLYQGVGIEIVVPMAFSGLIICGLTRRRRTKQLYRRVYAGELSRLEQCGK